VFANLGALGLVKTDLDTIVNELGYTSIKEVKATDVNKVLTAIKEMAKERKGE
jgi:ATP-dependent protease HslVU (ClpYQ) ATPase subunit